jgi:hypothetical protein
MEQGRGLHGSQDRGDLALQAALAHEAAIQVSGEHHAGHAGAAQLHGRAQACGFAAVTGDLVEADVV